MEPLTLDNLISALIGAIIGGAGAFFAAYAAKKGELRAFNENFSELVEQTRIMTEVTKSLESIIATKGDIGGEMREAARELTMAMATALHSMSWLCWRTIELKQVKEGEIRSHDETINEVSPQILGQLAVIAALDKETYDQLRDLPKQIFDLDEEIASEFVKFSTDQDASTQQLKKLHEKVKKLERDEKESLAARIANVVSKGAIKLYNKHSA